MPELGVGFLKKMVSFVCAVHCLFLGSVSYNDFIYVIIFFDSAKLQERIKRYDFSPNIFDFSNLIFFNKIFFYVILISTS